MYDAYGNIINMIDNSGISIGTINPFRYRSYYQDNETGWYYLNSRYYNPLTNRFVTMDQIEYLGASETILSINLYTYCEGNPINNIDPNGNAPFLGWGLQVEGSILGMTFGIELIWYKSIAKGLYSSNSFPCVYLYGGGGISAIGSNVWHIKSILNFVKDQALRAFSSTSKALWKMAVKNMGISLCAFMLYGTISSPYDYTGPFVSISATVFNIKAYVSTSPSGNVRAYGIGVSSSKFGFTPLSGTLYYMVPPKIVQNVIGSISTLFSRVKRISALA